MRERWAVDQASRMNEIDLKVEGETDEEKAASLVDAMLGAGDHHVVGVGWASTGWTAGRGHTTGGQVR